MNNLINLRSPVTGIHEKNPVAASPNLTCRHVNMFEIDLHERLLDLSSLPPYPGRPKFFCVSDLRSLKSASTIGTAQLFEPLIVI